MDGVRIEIWDRAEDGRWDDEAFVAEQASLSAAQDAYEQGQEIG